MLIAIKIARFLKQDLERCRVPNQQTLQTLSAKLSWSHFVKLFYIEDDLKQLSEENKMTTDLFFRDPYVLDFLELHDTYSEKDIENAILTELEKFILEM